MSTEQKPITFEDLAKMPAAEANGFFRKLIITQMALKDRTERNRAYVRKANEKAKKDREKYERALQLNKIRAKKYRDRQREKKKQLKEATATPKVIIIDEKNEP